jgi:hypothetical protein
VYSAGYAGGVSTEYILKEDAMAACLNLGASVCAAVTCRSLIDGGKCTMRGSSVLKPSFDSEITYVPSQICYTTDKGSTPLQMLEETLANSSANLTLVEQKFTMFKKFEANATKAHEDLRKRSVNLAKKVTLNNITSWRAQKAMTSAFYAQHSATEEAKNALANMKNAAAHVRYYEKVLVDKNQAIKAAEKAMKLGKDEINKALATLAVAKRSAKQYEKLEKERAKRQQKARAANLQHAFKASVAHAMETAYIESSPADMNHSNVPPGGRASSYSRKLSR